MPPNAENSQMRDRINYTVDAAHLDCPKKLQAALLAEAKVLNEQNGIVEKDRRKKGFFQFETDIKWRNAISLTILHLLNIYGVLNFPLRKAWRTFIWMLFMGGMGGFGVTGGVHRYWTHRSYKANVPYRILLMLSYCVAGQNTIFDWVRDHRVHHKFSETDADPHNSCRGFFFSHVGWLMLKKHPEVIRKGREVDMSDVLADPVVIFAEKYFLLLKLLMCFILPVVVPVYFWNESWYISIISQWFIRYVYVLNFTWSVNSAAHIWGGKPYDKNIAPAENRLVAFLAMGEGWHNYHHVFPWDYKAAELGHYRLNFTTAIIDFFARLGWVYDRKEPSPGLVSAVIKNRGDGSHLISQEVPMPEKNE